MSKIDGNRKVRNLPLGWLIDSSCFDSSSIYNNYKKSFLTVKTVKTRLQNKMDNEFRSDNLVIYIEKENATTFSTNSLIAIQINEKRRM